jgi:hypothetical protein
MNKRGFELKVELFWLLVVEEPSYKLSSQPHQEIRCVFMTLHKVISLSFKQAYQLLVQYRIRVDRKVIVDRVAKYGHFEITQKGVCNDVFRSDNEKLDLVPLGKKWENSGPTFNYD